MKVPYIRTDSLRRHINTMCTLTAIIREKCSMHALRQEQDAHGCCTMSSLLLKLGSPSYLHHNTCRKRFSLVLEGRTWLGWMPADHWTMGLGCPCTVQNSFTGVFSHTVWDLRATRKSGSLSPSSYRSTFLLIFAFTWREGDNAALSRH